VPGTRLSPASRKADVVVIAARYGLEDHRLTVAQAYERRGNVWSDLLLLDRDGLAERLRTRKRVHTGTPDPSVPGDFVLRDAVQLVGHDGHESMVADGRAAQGDDLGVPVF
jgi:hypothetical protein